MDGEFWFALRSKRVPIKVQQEQVGGDCVYDLSLLGRSTLESWLCRVCGLHNEHTWSYSAMWASRGSVLGAEVTYIHKAKWSGPRKDTATFQ